MATNRVDAATLDKLSAEFAEEQPKLDSAIKNFISLLAAEKKSSGSKKTSTIAMSHIIMMSRYVLNGLNDKTLLVDPIAFGQKFPQPTRQSAMDRIDELLKYKVAWVVGAKLAESGRKRTAFFGKSYFAATRIWDTLQNYVEGRVAADKCLWSSGNNEEVRAFPTLYMKQLKETMKEDPAESLVWCADLSSAMLQRQQQRQQRAKARSFGTKESAARSVDLTKNEIAKPH